MSKEPAALNNVALQFSTMITHVFKLTFGANVAPLLDHHHHHQLRLVSHTHKSFIAKQESERLFKCNLKACCS